MDPNAPQEQTPQTNPEPPTNPVPEAQPPSVAMPPVSEPAGPTVAPVVAPNAPQDSGLTSPPAQSGKYGVFRAIADSFRAIFKNPLAVIVSLLAVLVVSAVVFAIVGFGLSAIGKAMLGNLDIFSITSSLGQLVAFVVLLAVVVWLAVGFVQAFYTAAIAETISDGYDGRKSSIGTNLSKAVRLTPRLFMVSLLFGLIAFGPLALLFIVALLVSVGGASAGNASASVLVILATLAGLIWVLIASLRYALAPYVAVFETTLPVRETLKRSKQLLGTAGQWFIFKGVLLLLALYIIIAALTHSTLHEVDQSQSPLVTVFDIVASIVIVASLTLLYRKRAGLANAGSADSTASASQATV